MSNETDSDATSEVTTRMGEIEIHDNMGYASVPPPGSYSPPSQESYSPQLTPTDISSAPYSPYVEGAEYGYFTPQMTMSTLAPTFSPMAPSGQNPNYVYDIRSQPMGMVPGPMLNPNFTTLQAEYLPHTPMSNARGNADRGRGMGGNRVYRPPHIIAMEQQQHQFQQNHHAQIQAAAMAMHEMQGYGPSTGYADSRSVWYSPPPPPLLPRSARGGMYNSGQPNSVKNGWRTPMGNNGMERRPHNVNPRLNGNRNIPYTPRSNSSLADSRKQSFNPTYGPRTPSSSQRTAEGIREAAQEKALNPHFSGPPPGHSSVIRYPHIPYTPTSRGHDQAVLTEYNGQTQPVYRSSILEDFRINKIGRKWDLADIRGHMVEFSGDQFGSRYIQQKLESCSANDRQSIFDEIMPRAYTLMSDVFGNYVIQKMFELGDAKQKALLAKKMEGNVIYLSMHMYGCRVVQKALDYLPSDLRSKLVTELEPSYIQCVVSPNANHVIQRLVSRDPPEALSKAFVGSLEVLATNPYGCRVIQKMFELMPDRLKRDLLDEMHPISMSLMQDQFGNYVVQSVLTVGREEDRLKVVNRLKGQMFPMSRHKFASNVCEKALIHCRPEDRRELVDELIDVKPDGTTNVPMLLRDAFGNFPLQTALTCTEDDQRVKLLDLIIPVISQIANTPVGKRLQARFAAWEAEGLIVSATEAGANTRAYNESQAAHSNYSPGTQEEAHSREQSQPSSVSTTELSTDTPKSPSTTSSSDTEATTPPMIPQQIKRSSTSTPIRQNSRGSQKRAPSLQGSRQPSLADTSSNWRKVSSAPSPPAPEQTTSDATIVPAATAQGSDNADEETALEKLLK